MVVWTAKLITTLVRLACGTSLLIVHAVTGYNGVMLSVGLFLMGIPLEVLQHDKEEKEEIDVS